MRVSIVSTIILCNGIYKGTLMGTPKREPQEYSRNLIGIYLRGSFYSIKFLLYSWGSLFGVPIRVPLIYGDTAIVVVVVAVVVVVVVVGAVVVVVVVLLLLLLLPPTSRISDGGVFEHWST